MNKKIGVVGLGKMGRPMADFLAGHPSVSNFFVYDVNPVAINDLLVAHSNGSTKIQSVNTLTELGMKSDIIFIVVGFEQQVEDVCFGKEGLFSGMDDGIIVVCSTIRMEKMVEMQKRCPENVHFVDAPLCRGENAAKKAELLAIVGGESEDVEICLPYLHAFCSDVEHIGPLGAGQVGKALNNYLLWACTVASHEALTLGESYGLNQEVLRKALVKSSGQNWSLEQWHLPRPMPWAEKDMMIVLNMADNKNVSMPTAGTVKETIKLFKKEKGLVTPG